MVASAPGDAFVAKFSIAGTLLWTRQIAGGSGGQYVVDPSANAGGFSARTSNTSGFVASFGP